MPDRVEERTAPAISDSAPDPACIRLDWSGALDLGRAGTLAEEAAEALNAAAATAGGSLLIDLSTAESADLSALQVLLAAAKDAAARDLPFQIHAPADGAAARAAARAGIDLRARFGADAFPKGA